MSVSSYANLDVADNDHSVEGISRGRELVEPHECECSELTEYLQRENTRLGERISGLIAENNRVHENAVKQSENLKMKLGDMFEALSKSEQTQKVLRGQLKHRAKENKLLEVELDTERKKNGVLGSKITELSTCATELKKQLAELKNEYSRCQSQFNEGAVEIRGAVKEYEDSHTKKMQASETVRRKLDACHNALKDEKHRNSALIEKLTKCKEDYDREISELKRLTFHLEQLFSQSSKTFQNELTATTKKLEVLAAENERLGKQVTFLNLRIAESADTVSKLRLESSSAAALASDNALLTAELEDAKTRQSQLREEYTRNLEQCRAQARHAGKLSSGLAGIAGLALGGGAAYLASGSSGKGKSQKAAAGRKRSRRQSDKTKTAKSKAVSSSRRR